MDGKEKVCLKVITGTAMGLNQAYQYLISEWLSEMLSEKSKLSTSALLIYCMVTSSSERPALKTLFISSVGMLLSP